MNPTEVKFSQDWFSSNIPEWQKYLQPWKGLENLRYLEVGSFEGRSVIWLFQNIFTAPSCRGICIDLFHHPTEERLRRNLQLSGLETKIEVLKGPSNALLRPLPFHSFDVIYVDGSHEKHEVLRDLVLCWDLLKSGGFMIVDDYELHHHYPVGEDVKIMTDAFLLAFEPKIKVHYVGFQVIFEKISG